MEAAPVTTCPRCGDVDVYPHGAGWACSNPDCGVTWERIIPSLATVEEAPS